MEQLFRVGKEEELRFEVEEGWVGKIQLTSGTGEVFGVQCVLNRAYELGVGKYAVFSWHGCEVVLSGTSPLASPKTAGPTSNAYAKDASLSMVCNMNVHIKLEHDREQASLKKLPGGGPITMIVGPTDSGKSTTARTLCAYAVRRGRQPCLVDLDPGQNDLTIPGALAATICSLNESSISVEHGVQMGQHPLVEFYGYISPSDGPEAYKRAVGQLASTVSKRVDASCSGTIINTCGYVEGPGYALLLDCIATFKPTLILVMGQDLLQSKLKKNVAEMHFPTACDVVKVPVSGGATTRNQEFRKRNRNRKIREYFYGSKPDTAPLTSCSIELSFDQVSVVRVPNKDDNTLSSMRPVGKASALDPNLPRPVDLVPALLQNSVLAVSFAEDEAQVLTTNVAGFVHIQSVDVEHRTLTVLSPQKGPLPGKFLVMGGVKWVDGG